MKTLALLLLMITELGSPPDVISYGQGNGQKAEVGPITIQSASPNGYRGYARIRLNRDVTGEKFNLVFRRMNADTFVHGEQLTAVIDKIEVDGKIIEVYFKTRLLKHDIIQVHINGTKLRNNVWVE